MSTATLAEEVGLAFYAARRLTPVGCLEHGDLIQESFIGMHRAAGTYNEARGPWVPHALMCARQRALTTIGRERRHAECVRLDAPAGVEERETFLDTIADDKTPAPDAGADLASVRPRLSAAFRRLGAREREIIRMRYGGDATLDEIGRHISLSGERVRMIERRALRSLRLALGGVAFHR